MSTTIRLLVEVRNEKPAYEQVHVEDRGAGTYRLLQSPGFVLGLAADDVFELEPGGTFKLLRRGGNISIQMFSNDPVERAGRMADHSERLAGRDEGLQQPDGVRVLGEVAHRSMAVGTEDGVVVLLPDALETQCGVELGVGGGILLKPPGEVGAKVRLVALGVERRTPALW